jgi:hypothetical protein
MEEGIVGKWHSENYKESEFRVFVTPMAGLIEPISPDTQFRFWGHVVLSGEDPPERGGPQRWIRQELVAAFASPRAALDAGIRACRDELDRIGMGQQP